MCTLGPGSTEFFDSHSSGCKRDEEGDRWAVTADFREAAIRDECCINTRLIVKDIQLNSHP